MAARTGYAQEHYRTAAECVAGIRKSFARGWELLEIRGAQPGPFTAVFRIEDIES
jgi:hypothetical protein